MSKKTRKLSIRTKIMLPMCMLITSVCCVMGVSSYKSINAGMVEVGGEIAQMGVKIALSEIDKELVRGITPGCEQTEEYQIFLDELSNIQQECGMANLYTLYMDGTQIYYGIYTPMKEKKIKVGDSFDRSYSEEEQFKTVFSGEEFVLNYIEMLDYGNYISAYLPIQNATGEIVGVLGCDYDASGILNRLNASNRQVTLQMILCLLVAFAMLLIITRQIMKDLYKVNQKIHELVNNEGDLTQEIKIHSGDETELIADNVNKLLYFIRKIMLNISGNSVQLNNSSENISNYLSNAEVNITDVSATMEEMSSSMEEISASINQINDAIANMYDSVGTIAENATNGSVSSSHIMSRAESIREKTQQDQEEAKRLAREMADLVNESIEKSKAVEEINGLTSNIISITEQTNLLSLNASIEAARAGEAGKGFAVVAGEIGTLAANSADIAVQIQHVSAEVVGAVNELAQKAEQMLHFMDETAMSGYEKLLETSETYQSDVGDLNSRMQEFADESLHVKKSMDQIKEAISAVAIAVEESAKGVVNATEMSVDLKHSVIDIGTEAKANIDVANQLSNEVNKFKLEQ